MAKKIQLQDANGNVLHPLTLGECVTMNNGENLDTLMSKSQMFTPTITQDKSMFKVGTGVDVDYSANVKDGAYESLVFKGKSLVNLLTKTIDTTWNLNLENWSIVSTTLSDYVLKPNTTYSVIVYVTEKTCPDRDDLFWVGDVDGKKDKVTHDIVRKNVSLGTNVFVINTVSDFSSITSAYRGGINFQGSKFVEGTLKWKAIVLEGDWTNKELPPYFTGLCDSKMPILQNTGENLFDPNSPLPDNLNYFYNSDNKNQLTTHAQMLSCAIPVIKGKTYSFYFNHDEIPLKVHKSGVFPTFVSGGVGGNGYAHNVRTITAPMDGYFGIMFCYTEDGTTDNWTKVARDWKKQLKLTIVEGKSINTYIPYKTNILRTSEEIVLREVNGVQDTYNPLTGEYVRRISEVVFDGSSDEDWSVNKNIAGGKQFVYNASLGAKGGNATVISDKLPSIVDANESHVENIWIYNGTTIVIHKNLQDANELKTWLSQNPITVQYELAEPATTIVKPSTMTPFAYQNGHVILESGFEGQSLLPEIEYSVVTGRTGQVTQNTKVLRKQEQQIIGLEELLLTQVVQMEYERTLLQFDYELQMMMLG